MVKEEKYPVAEEMMETMMDGVCVISPDARIIKVNAALEKLTGYTRDELIGEVLIKVFPKGETKKILTWIREYKEKGFVRNFETVFLRRDKKEISILLNSTCAKDAEGKPKWMIATFRDITERKRAEEALRESEERYRRLVETMNEGFNILDENGLLIYANDKFCKMLGYSRDEIIGHHISEFVDKSNQNIAKEQLDRERKGERVSYEVVRVRKDGQKIFTITSASPILDADGHFKGSFAVVADITERKRAEEVRAKAAVIEAMGDGLILLGMDGKIASVNPAFEKMTSYGKSELVEKDIADVTSKLVKSGDLKKTMGILGTALERKVPAPLTVTFVSKDGREIPVTFTISSMKDARGKPTTLILNIKDITELKRLEEERVKADKRQIEELEKFTKIAVGRELKMVELKKRIKELEERLKNVPP